MGWFWASSTAQSSDEPVAVVPPSAWMNEYIQNTFWAPKADIWAKPAPDSGRTSSPQEQPTKCPVDHSKWAELGRRNISEGASVAPQAPASVATPSACPVDHTQLTTAQFNKLNNMPSLHAHKLPGQKVDLPTDRTTSSIPRGEKPDAGFWEYPSPQQMLNAMVRKSGPDGIEESAVESMVDVHNFLNEGVWEEVLQWEKPHTEASHVQPRLLQFKGRPGELSPKARLLQMLGRVYPSKFGVPPPFDRHDWTVLRALPGQNDTWKQVRYVIDFYEIPDVDDSVPTFTVDVRPAADSIDNLVDRARVAWGPVLKKALGWE